MMEISGKVRQKVVKVAQRRLQEFQRLTWLASRRGRESQRQLVGLWNQYSVRRCFIMGNGPSLKLIDLKLLKDEVTIGSNGIFLIRDEMGFLPTFLTVEDTLVAEDRAAQLNNIRETTKVFPFDLSYCLAHDEKTIFVNFLRSYAPFPQFSGDFSKRVYWGGTVTFMNIQLAYYLGCKEIYLVGLDHNYVVPDRSKIVDTVILSDQDDVNHIHPDYFGKGYRWHDPNVARMEQSYIIARRFLEAKGVRIMNATVGGKLEVFSRISFDSLVKQREV